MARHERRFRAVVIAALMVAAAVGDPVQRHPTASDASDAVHLSPAERPGDVSWSSRGARWLAATHDHLQRMRERGAREPRPVIGSRATALA